MSRLPSIPVPRVRLFGPVERDEWALQHNMRERGRRLADYHARRGAGHWALDPETGMTLWVRHLDGTTGVPIPDELAPQIEDAA